MKDEKIIAMAIILILGVVAFVAAAQFKVPVETIKDILIVTVPVIGGMVGAAVKRG